MVRFPEFKEFQEVHLFICIYLDFSFMILVFCPSLVVFRLESRAPLYHQPCYFIVCLFEWEVAGGEAGGVEG